MDDELWLHGRSLAGVSNARAGEVDPETEFDFRQDGDRLAARYAGGAVGAGHLPGTLDGSRWDVRYVQRNVDGEAAAGHSVGEVSRLPGGRVRVTDEWSWQSRPGGGTSVLEEVRG